MARSVITMLTRAWQKHSLLIKVSALAFLSIYLFLVTIKSVHKSNDKERKIVLNETSFKLETLNTIVNDIITPDQLEKTKHSKATKKQK